MVKLNDLRDNPGATKERIRVGRGIGSGKGKTGADVEAAKTVGKLIAERAKEKGIGPIVFDRGQFIYHGRVKALAESAREGGLDF